jgi:hypothetical protein
MLVGVLAVSSELFRPLDMICRTYMANVVLQFSARSQTRVETNSGEQSGDPSLLTTMPSRKRKPKDTDCYEPSQEQSVVL